MFKILGTDDSVNSCDCCGKSGLKHTVVVEINGEEFHYGSTCATKHTGMKSSQIKSAIESRIEEIKKSASMEFSSSIENITHQAKLNELTKSGVRPGKEFMKLQEESATIANSKKKEIAAKFNLEIYSF